MQLDGTVNVVGPVTVTVKVALIAALNVPPVTPEIATELPVVGAGAAIVGGGAAANARSAAALPIIQPSGLNRKMPGIKPGIQPNNARKNRTRRWDAYVAWPPGGAEGIALPMRAGEAVAFSGLLVHGSKANRGNAVRHAFYLRYCEPATRMVSLGGKPVLEDGYSWMVSGEAE